MTAKAIAEFLVAREPGEGYCVRRQVGTQAGRLRDRAVEVLDMMGPIRPSGRDTLDAWLGPIGEEGAFVRVQVWKGDADTLFFWQVWFAAGNLPDHPSDVVCSLKRPTDPEPVVAEVRQVYASRQSLLYRYHPETDALELCRAITDLWSDAVARRVTWITDTEHSDVPVHLRLCRDAAAAEGVALQSQPLSQKTSVAQHRPRSLVRRLAFPLTALALLFVAGFAVGRSFQAGVQDSPQANPETPAEPSPGRGRVVDAPPESAVSEDIVRLKTALRRSSEVTQRLQDLLARPHVAADPNAAVVDPVKTVELRITHDVGTIEAAMGDREDRVRRFRSTEARQLLDLLLALDQLDTP